MTSDEYEKWRKMIAIARGRYTSKAKASQLLKILARVDEQAGE